jgi:hypothetical protein
MVRKYFLDSPLLRGVGMADSPDGKKHIVEDIINQASRIGCLRINEETDHVIAPFL